MTNSGKMCADELIEWLIEAGFIKSQCQMSIYYKYAPDDSKIVVYLMLMIVSTSIQMEILERFVDTLGKISHVNFVGYAHWFMSIRISQLKDHYISVDQARYATSIVTKYLDNAKVKVSNKFYKTTFTADMIFTKKDVFTSDEQVEKLTR